MTPETALEQRLIMLEKAVADLQRQAADKPVSGTWLDNIIGSISDDEAFLEALEYGRNFRQSDRPEEEPAEQF